MTRQRGPEVPRQRGLAVVLAILVVALAASTAIYLVWQQTVALRQIENLDTRAQVREIARAGTTWAAAILSQDDPKIDDLNEAWAQPLPAIDVEHATLEGGMIDEQSKFNLNNVWQPSTPPAPGTTVPPNPWADAFRVMLTQLGIKPTLCDALIDYIDTDSAVTAPDGAEDSYYLGQTPPYRAANHYLTSVGELRLIAGFTPQIVDRLAPYVTALPTSPTPVNINTATADMIAVFMPEVDPNVVVNSRKKAPFTSTADLTKLVGDQSMKRVSSLLGINSNFFSAQARVTQGRTSITYRAILQRAASGWPTILSITEEPM